MRRKLNTRLLLWTVTAALVSAVAVAAVHDLQFRRNIDVLMRRAQQAFKEDQLDLAARYLEQYLAYNPHDTAALVQYARTLGKIADSPAAQYEAFLVMEQAVRRAPLDLALRREAADLAQDVGRFAEAVEHFRVLLKHNPKDAPLWQDLGWCQEGQGQTDQAEASYRKAIELDPHLLLAYARLGNLLLRLHRSSEVPAVLDEMVAANPTSFAALLARADYLQATGAPKQAWPDVEQAYQLAPEQRAVILAKAGMEEHKGDLAQARTALTQGLKHHPGDRALYEALVRVELKDGQPDQALSWLREEIHCHPQDLTLRFQLFDLILGQGDQPAAEKALAELKKAEGEPGYLWRYAEAALLVSFAGPADAAKLQLARQRLDEVKKRQPDWNQPLLLEGLLEELAGHKAKAVQLYQGALKLGPAGPAYLYRLAELLAERQDYVGAAAVLAKIEEQAKLTPAQARLGADVALHLDDLPRAALLARLAVAEDARDYRDHLWQAKVLALAGQTAEAEAVLRQLVKTSPSVPEVWVALVQRLAQSGQHAAAGEVLAQIPQQLPAAKVKLTLARCHEALGNLKQAEQLFTANVQLQPDGFMGWKHLAEFHLRHQQYAQAEPWLRQLLDPENAVPPELTQAARHHLAVALAHQDDPAKYKEALALVPAGGKAVSPDDAVARARVLATKAAQRPEAIQMVEKVRQQQPLPAEAAFALAQWYRQEGQPAKAAALLHDLLIAGNESPEYLAEYARCLLAQKDVTGAQFYVNRLQQWQPAHPQLPELKSLLESAQPPQ